MLVETAVGILFAALTVTTVYQFIKKYVITWFDRQTPLVQQAVVALFAAIVIPIFHYVGVNLPADVHLWSIDAINTALTTVGAWGFHSLWKALKLWWASRHTTTTTTV
jgi:hypothetical protein